MKKTDMPYPKEGKPDFPVSLAKERRRIFELEELLVLIRDRSDCPDQIQALINTALEG